MVLDGTYLGLTEMIPSRLHICPRRGLELESDPPRNTHGEETQHNTSVF